MQFRSKQFATMAELSRGQMRARHSNERGAEGLEHAKIAARKRKGGKPSTFASEGVSYNAVTAMEPHLIDLLDHPVIVAPHLHAKPFLGFSGSHASFAVRKRESTLECFGAPRVERKAACGRT